MTRTTTPVRIIGIDPGLQHTGWGIIVSEGVRLQYKASGVIHSEPAAGLAERLQDIYQGLQLVHDKWQPEEAAVEETFVNKSGTATLKLGQARGIAMVVPALFGISVAEYASTRVKKTVVGVGRAGKGQVGMMVKHLLPKANVQSEDEADALAIAITHAQFRGQREMERKLASR